MQLRHVGFAPDYVDYETGWAIQRQVHADRVADQEPDTLLLLEHTAVYTAGKRTLPIERPQGGAPVVDVDRGGKITWHGPGQLVGYPIVKLGDPIDVVAYVRSLERALMAVCADVGLATTQVDGRSGVWVVDGVRPDRKIAAIGIRVAQGVAMHGFSLNCDCDLAVFSSFIPCGIADAGVTSLTAELGRHVGVQDVLAAVEERMLEALSPVNAA